MFCQIERCCLYGDRFGRTVIVETDNQCAIHFRDRLSTYFRSRQPRLVLDASRFRARFDRVQVFPAALQGRVTSYEILYNAGLNRFVEVVSGVRPTFDFERDYGEALLVHQDFDGGRLSLGAMKRMRLRDPIAAELNRRRRVMGGSYEAVHIRNTDYQTRYRDHLDDLARRVDGPIFIATDNRETLEHCRQAFGAWRVFSFSDLDVPPGQPLHELRPGDPVRERNTDAIVDLVMLAMAERIHSFQLAPNSINTTISGFTELAIGLHEAPDVLRRLAPQAYRRPFWRIWR